MNTCSTYENSLKTEIGVLKISCCTKGVHSVQIIEKLCPCQSCILNEGVQNVEVPECLTVTMQWMKNYFEGQITQEYPDICPIVFNSKDALTQQVWSFLKNNPAVIAYSDLAANCGGCCTQAVETVVRSNPVPLIVPCHRVVSEERRDLKQFFALVPERYSVKELQRYLGSHLQEWLLLHEARCDLERNAERLEREAPEREARHAELEALYEEREARFAEREARKAEREAQNEDYEASDAEREARRVERDGRNALRERRKAMREAHNAERMALRAKFEVQKAEREARRVESLAQNALREARRAEIEAEKAKLEARRVERRTKGLALEARALMLEEKVAAYDRRLQHMRQQLNSKVWRMMQGQSD